MWFISCLYIWLRCPKQTETPGHHLLQYNHRKTDAIPAQAQPIRSPYSCSGTKIFWKHLATLQIAFQGLSKPTFFKYLPVLDYFLPGLSCVSVCKVHSLSSGLLSSHCWFPDPAVPGVLDLSHSPLQY